MLNKLQNDPVFTGWRSRIIFILMIIMMIALFFSRVLLSASMIAFIFLSFLHLDFKKQIVTFFSSPLLLGMSFLFLLPALSGLWSQNEEEWITIIRIKLPLLLMPLAFASPFGLSKKHWQGIIVLFIGLITAGTIWSMTNYFLDINTVNENYLRSQIMITPLENDHVQFSWLVAIAILSGGWLCWRRKEKENKTSWILLITTTWLVIFLHILAARTGLFSFYLMLFTSALWFIYKKARLIYAGTLLFILIALPLMAYFIFPTFHNRVKYFLYDLPYFSKAHYKEGMNDAVRVISVKAGWNVMNNNPVSGVGFGDILTETKKWYTGNYSQIAETDKIYPSSEWLIYGAGCGWPGFIVFTIIMLIPFFYRPPGNKILWFLLNAGIAFTFLFDNGLEVQFGVFIYSFIVLCWWKWLRS